MAKSATMKRKPKMEPTPGGSTYVKPQDMEWKPTPFEGVSIKMLYDDPSTGDMTCLLEWEPGSCLAFHEHADVEQSYVFKGSFYDHAGTTSAGEFVWRTPHSRHEARTDEGVLMLSTFKKPNIFFDKMGSILGERDERIKTKAGAGDSQASLEPTDGSTFVKPQDMEWKPTPFEGVSIKALYEDKTLGELTCLLKWEPGAHLPFHKHPAIEQTFVLEGSFYDHDGIARAGEYAWRKPGSFHETHSDEGAVILAIYRKPNIFFDKSGDSSAGYAT